MVVIFIRVIYLKTFIRIFYTVIVLYLSEIYSFVYLICLFYLNVEALPSHVGESLSWPSG